jgi:hypothetical protein
LEERDLTSVHGQAYADYRKRVPMLTPGMGRKAIEDPIRPISSATI